MDMDEEGNLYLAQPATGQILKEAMKGGSYTETVVDTGLVNSFSVAVDGSGSVYFPDQGTNQIFKETAHALGVEPQIVHIPSDLIVAYRPDELGSLTGDKINSAVFDNSKIKRLVPDFVCNVKWAEGVRRSIAWFEADPARRTIDAEMNQSWDRILAAYERAFPG